MKALWPAILAISLWSCSENQSQIAKPQPTPDPNQLAGPWFWMHEQDDGLRRTAEYESWHLSRIGDNVYGFYQRRVDVTMSGDKVFRCANSKSFTLFATFQVSGHIDGKSVVLSEKSSDAKPHPCEPTTRQLASYQGTLAEETLTLVSSEGTQTLTREPVPSDNQMSSELRGTWSWKTTNKTPTTQTTESEQWSFEGDKGHYTRVVETTRVNGKKYKCSRSPTKSWRLKVNFRIVSHGAIRRLIETNITLQDGDQKCIGNDWRVDSAYVVTHPRGLELQWRGGHRQLLEP